MRLRNIPRAESVLRECKEVVKNASEHQNHWKKVFGNAHPVHIEIGMGKGQFLLTLARRNPEINYIGIERYSSVLLRAVEKYEKFSADTQKPLPNIRFICMDAREITEVFAPGEVGKIYLNFSDPWPKARHAKRRLTSREFLARYEKILVDRGEVEFKTDNRTLFDFSLEEIRDAGWTLLACTYDLHRDARLSQGNVMTEYEEKFSGMGKPICKLIAARK